MSAVQYHRKSTQAVGAARLPGPEKAAGAGTGVLQEAMVEKADNSLCGPLLLGH